MRLLWIAIFGLVGIFARYFIGVGVARTLNPPYPLATFAINLTGSLLIGLVYVLGIEKSAIDPEIRIGLMVGLLGGYTTFSSYSLETYLLFESGRRLAAILYVTSSPILGLAATALGVGLGRLIGN